MGPKMAERWILALPEKWGKCGPGKWEKWPEIPFRTMARNSIFEPFLGHFFHFPGHFSHFPGHFSPIFQVRPKSIFGHFRPEMDLHQVHGIPAFDLWCFRPDKPCSSSCGIQDMDFDSMFWGSIAVSGASVRFRSDALTKMTNPGTTPITILAINSDHGLSFGGEETRTMV